MLDEAAVVRRLRADDPTRPIGDALIDQRTIAGIGNMWKAEGCFAAGVDPWRRAGDVSDEEALAIVRACRGPMLESAVSGRHDGLAVYGKAGEPCPRCGSRIAARGQGDDNRRTYWCPSCQR
jgi:endonuclease-8